MRVSILYIALTLLPLCLSVGDSRAAVSGLQAWSDQLAVARETRRIEQEPVAPTERVAEVQLIREVAIGERGSDSAYLLYDADYAVADGQGRIFVRDSGNKRIQVFDAAGEYLLTIGREGQGPGEFSELNTLAVRGDTIVAGDRLNGRFSLFSSDGSLVETVRSEDFADSIAWLVGRDDGTYVALLAMRHSSTTVRSGVDPRLQSFRVAALSSELDEIRGLVAFPEYYRPMALRQVGRGLSMVRVDVPYAASPAIAAGSKGVIYASTLDKYEIVAFRAGGGAEWVLESPWPQSPITEAEIDEAVGRVRESRGWDDFARSEFDWPEQRPAIDRIAVDGHNNLYVFPYGNADVAEHDLRMVDVYGPGGDRVLSGWIADVAWFFAYDDYVLAQEVDESSGEERIVRYRLRLPS
jgi:hypothetical protein